MRMADGRTRICGKRDDSIFLRSRGSKPYCIDQYQPSVMPRKPTHLGNQLALSKFRAHEHNVAILVKLRTLELWLARCHRPTETEHGVLLASLSLAVRPRRQITRLEGAVVRAHPTSQECVAPGASTQCWNIVACGRTYLSLVTVIYRLRRPLGGPIGP